jgi:replicative DNA helicase
MPVLMTEDLQRQYDSISHTGAERAVLSISMNNPETLFDISTNLIPEDFANIANRHIFDIMLSILDGKYANISKVNPMIINAIASQSGSQEEIGGMQYLEMIQRSDAGEENLDYYVGLVKQASIRRESFKKAISVMSEAVDNEDEDTDSFMARQEEKFLDIIMKSSGKEEVVQVGCIIDNVLDRISSSPREILGMPTGFTEYDRQTGGLVPGRLKVWAAVAKTGKSAMALNIAINVAVRQGLPVLYIDTEMSTEEQLYRMISILATELASSDNVVVPESAVSKGLFAKNEKMARAVELAKEMIKAAPFYHIYLPDFTPEKVHNLARQWQRKIGIDWNGYETPQMLLIFDYIKTPEDASKNPNMKEYQVLGDITNMLKNKTAGMLQIPVLAFAQLNPRTGHGAEDVNSSHMSGSNRIVMYANELAFLRKKTSEELANDGPQNGNLVFKLG